MTRYFCARCKRELSRQETFLEPFTCVPDRYTKCCADGHTFTPVLVEHRDGTLRSYDP